MTKEERMKYIHEAKMRGTYPRFARQDISFLLQALFEQLFEQDKEIEYLKSTQQTAGNLALEGEIGELKTIILKGNQNTWKMKEEIERLEAHLRACLAALHKAELYFADELTGGMNEADIHCSCTDARNFNPAMLEKMGVEREVIELALKYEKSRNLQDWRDVEDALKKLKETK